MGALPFFRLTPAVTFWAPTLTAMMEPDTEPQPSVPEDTRPKRDSVDAEPEESFGPETSTAASTKDDAASSEAPNSRAEPQEPAPGLQQWQAILLLVIIIGVVLAEAWLLVQPGAKVPLLPDKVLFSFSLLFQVLLVAKTIVVACQRRKKLEEEGQQADEESGTASNSQDLPARTRCHRCQSIVLDLVHWVFIIVIFGGAVVLRATESLILIAFIAAMTFGLRLVMGHECILTLVAQRTSLPDIPGSRVTAIFLTLLLVVITRIVLEILYGPGFPIDQLWHLIFPSAHPVLSAMAPSSADLLMV